jgi:hypothetical protein
VALERTDVSEKPIASIIRVKRISDLMMEATLSFEMSVLARVTRCYFPEDNIRCNHRSESLKSYDLT